MRAAELFAIGWRRYLQPLVVSALAPLAASRNRHMPPFCQGGCGSCAGLAHHLLFELKRMREGAGRADIVTMVIVTHYFIPSPGLASCKAQS